MIVHAPLLFSFLVAFLAGIGYAVPATLYPPDKEAALKCVVDCLWGAFEREQPMDTRGCTKECNAERFAFGLSTISYEWQMLCMSRMGPGSDRMCRQEARKQLWGEDPPRMEQSLDSSPPTNGQTNAFTDNMAQLLNQYRPGFLVPFRAETKNPASGLGKNSPRPAFFGGGKIKPLRRPGL